MAAVTLEDVWRTFEESDRRFNERTQEFRLELAAVSQQIAALGEKSAAVDHQIAETDRQIAETDRKLAELSAQTNRQFAETDRKLAELNAETNRQIAETGRQMAELNAETGRQMAELNAETRRTVAETCRRVDALTGKWGRFVEGMVIPAAKTVFAARGIPVHGVNQRMSRTRNGRHMEIDVLVVNRTHVVAVEVKSTLSVADVREHLDRLATFKEFFLEYRDYAVIGAVAGMVIEEGVDRFAYRQGLFVLGQHGETVRILNDDGFRPAAW